MKAGSLTERLAALQLVLRQAIDQRRIGTIRSIDVLLRSRGLDIDAMVDLALAQADAVFGTNRQCLRRIASGSDVLLLGNWTQGQIATISVGLTDGRELVDIVILGSEGSLAHRWTGGDDEAL